MGPKTAAILAQSAKMILWAAHSWCSGPNPIGSGCEHGFDARAPDAAPRLTSQSQCCRAKGSLWDGTADLFVEGIHHDVDVVAENAVEAHTERRLQLVVELQVPAEGVEVEPVE